MSADMTADRSVPVCDSLMRRSATRRPPFLPGAGGHKVSSGCQHPRMGTLQANSASRTAQAAARLASAAEPGCADSSTNCSSLELTTCVTALIVGLAADRWK